MNNRRNILHNLHPIRKFKYRIGYYEKQKKSCMSLILTAALCMAAVCAAFYGVEKRIAPIAFKTGEASLKNGLTAECNRILEEITGDGSVTSDIMLQNRNESGKVTSVAVNFAEVNRIKTYSAQRIAEYLESRKNIDCSVPIGSLVSDGIFSGYGFDIPVNLVCTADFDINFDDDFCSAGINQVRHRLMIKVAVNASLCSVFERAPICVVTDIPIAETVISGDVPVLNAALTNADFGN